MDTATFNPDEMTWYPSVEDMLDAHQVTPENLHMFSPGSSGSYFETLCRRAMLGPPPSHTPRMCESQLGEFMAEMLGKIHTFQGIAVACDRARERFVLPADESSEY